MLQPQNVKERIQSYARSYLNLDPDPIPKLLILRDLLNLHPTDHELLEAKSQALSSHWINELATEQNPNGGWSRFHSMNSKARHKIPTTEYAVYKALSLGLAPGDTILTRAQSYLEGLLKGTILWPEDEYKEPNDRWATGEEMFITATLAMIAPQHPLIQGVIEKWCQITEMAFSSGYYDPEQEWHAHCQLTGATTMRNSYLVLNNQYALTILGCANDRLKPQTEQALLDWIWTNSRGVGYLNVPLHTQVTHLHPREIGRWFASHQILARFSSWRVRVKPAVDTLWSMQTTEGFWDFGAKASPYNFHLSESWRNQKKRLIDQSLRVLLLLNCFKWDDI